MNRYYKVSLWFLLLVFVLVSLACDKKNSVGVELDKAIENRFGVHEPTGEDEPASIDMLIDTTVSMRGYANFQFGVLEKFLVDFSTSLKPTEIYYYALFSGTKKYNHYQHFIEPGSYKETLTDLSKIKSYIKPDNIVILLTDFQFNTHNGYLELIPIFQDIFAEGKFIEFIGGQFPYDGTVYHEINGGTKAIPHKGMRPLYAIIIGPRKNYKFINDRFDKLPIWEHRIPFLNFKDTKITDIKFRGYNEAFLKYSVPSSSKSQYFKDYFRNETQEAFTCKLDINNDIFKTWNIIRQENILVETYHLKNKKTLEPVSPEIFSVKIEKPLLVNQTFSMQVKTDVIDRRYPKLLRILIRPSDLPEWVTEWNCAPTASPEIIKNHTVLLKDFVEKIVSSYKYPLTLTSLYIFIDN